MDIHRVDRTYRNRTLLLLTFIALLCVVALLLLVAWLGRVDQQLAGSDPQTVQRWLRGLLVVLGLALAVPAGLLGRGLRQLGLQSRIEGRFPPNDWKTLRDVRVLRDASALRWARRTELLGFVALALSALLVSWAIWAWWRFS